MIRFLDRAIATPVQIFGPFLFFLLILVAGALIGLGWQFWPRWIWPPQRQENRTEASKRRRNTSTDAKGQR